MAIADSGEYEEWRAAIAGLDDDQVSVAIDEVNAIHHLRRSLAE